MGRGKHFIGDFLPPDELEKFMETFKALKVGKPMGRHGQEGN
jgi:splicing factor 4